MKKLFTSLCFIALLVISSHAQTVIINTGTAGTPAYNAGPVYRSAAGSAFDASRYSYLYTAAELSAAGITSGSVINLVGWVKNNTATSLGLGGIFRIYMKNTSAASFSLASETWANLNTGAVMVYQNLTQTIPATANPNYIDFTLNTPFTYTGGSLEISTEWDINQVSGNASTGTFDWLWSTVVDRIYGTGNTTLAPITTLSSTTNSISTIDNRRPFIKITYTGGTTGIDVGAQSLVAPAVSPNNCYTSAEAVTIKIRNYSTNPINFSVNPMTVTTNVTGAVTQTLTGFVNTGPLAPAATLDVPMTGTLNMGATGVYTFNAFTTVTGDVTPANDAMTAVNITKAVLAAGTASATPGSYCVTPGTPTLSTTGATGYGSLQWQESTTPGAGFANIPGATTTPYTLGTPITQTMYYRLIASCNGNNVTSNETTVTLINPQITGTTPGVSCGPGPVTVSLAATGTGTTFNWYAAPAGGLPIGTGSPFITPPISANTTYYVSASSGGGTANLGLPAQLAGTSGFGTTNFGLVFDALVPFTLNSVVVYPVAAAANTAGTVTIDVINSAGTIINTATVNVIGNPVATANTVNLNFNIAAGTNLKLRPGSRSASITALLFEPSATAPGGNYGYPFVVPGVVSIKHSTLTAAPANTARLDLYYYFYNWTIATGCESARTAVLATVTTPPAATISYAGSPYCTTAGTATVTQTGTAGGTYSSTAGLTINAATGAVTLGTSTPGTYTVTYTVAASGGCPTYTTTAIITVNDCTSTCLENFDGVSAPALPATWAATVGATCAGTARWATTSAASSSAPNSVFANDPNCISDEYLDSKVYAIGAAPQQFVFMNNYNLENGFDGMVLEISINGGAFTDILIAGGTFVTGGYNGSISVNFSSPIAGRQAWTGNSGGFITTRINLPAAASGQNVVFRFRRATDSSVAATGVYVDDVYVIQTATISYAGSPYCSNAGTATVTRTGAAGGTYSATPAGLTLNAANGNVTLGTSTPGTYTVTYTIAPGGACLAFTTATTTITITALPAATIVYSGSPYCSNAGTANVTRTGTAGGTYTATPAGLTLNAATGAVTLGTSTPGTYTVTYTIAAAGGCPAVTASTNITITALPAATITYAGSPYCSTDLTATVTRTGTAGGTYSAAPAGLTINAATGTVTPNTSTPGTYTVTYTIPAGGGCPVVTATTTITITQAPNIIILYMGTPYCSNAGTATVTQFGTPGGTYTAAPAGLVINAATGAVTLGTSTPGTYTVTYTVPASGGCGITFTTTTITITAAPAATISYAGSPYCSNAGTANVTRTGTAGGTYSSTPGLTINATTGAVTLGTSTPGTYTVTYTIAASGGCGVFTTTTTITITALPAATISYAGTPYCSNAGTATVTRTGTAGGTYTAAPAGLTINAATGAVTLGTSTPGTYTVTYTIAAGGGCPAVTATTTITITALPAATITYAGSPYCQGAGTATVTRTGTAGGVYSSTAGLIINAATGDVNLATSTPGTYTVSYTLAASGGCPAVVATTTITINSLSVAPTAATASPAAICGSGSVTLSVTGGSLGSGGVWRWYTGSCGGTLVGTGATLNVTVATTTTYFVRAEGTCNTTACVSVTVTVNVQPTISIAASLTSLKPFQTSTLTATVSPAAGSTTVWYRNGVLIPGATGLTYIVDIDKLGTYTARTTTAAGCTALSNAVTITADVVTQLFITPNPNNGQFKVRYYTSANSLGFVRHLVMFNEKGQKVFDQTYPITAPYSSMDIDARRLPKGIYIVMLTDAFGKEVLATGKVVLQ